MNTILALFQMKGVGRKTIWKLKDELETCGNELSDIRNLPLPVNVTMEEWRRAVEQAKYIEEECENADVHICTFKDKEFPGRFRGNIDAPVLVYYKGDIHKIANPSVAVIGTRKPSEQGRKVAKNLGYVLGRDHYSVISGLAVGCDEYAHRGCLDADGYTVAVLPSGIKQIYPKSNNGLAEKIVERGGCLISEYSPNQSANKAFFVERDRIQSMLSDGVLVVEAEKNSGTMHTVEYAHKYNKAIGCYRNMDYIVEMPSGNQYLLEQMSALGVGNNQDLDMFKKRMEEYVNRLNTSYRQMSLFEEMNDN